MCSVAEQTAEELVYVLFSPVYKSNILVKNSNSVESKTTSRSHPAGPGFLRRVGAEFRPPSGALLRFPSPKAPCSPFPTAGGCFGGPGGFCPETRSFFSPPSSGPFGSLHAA